ncbi:MULTISPECIES: hypothetical protein [unclassified Burkholderia]|uniref:hypothetical protein n=1 Tax=unclassified Burkholderia TaxID=2613784 RepID=UPI000F5EA76F|nr:MULTISPECIES: hypothetical protein [unclassified Burkholderia]RQZ33329.1 hypothetical protein DIE13_17000 [Burkholderia sp. Bp9016]
MNDRLKKNIDIAPEMRAAFEGRYEMHWEDAAIHTQMLWRDAWQDAREAAGQEAAIVRDNPDDIGTIIEATRPLEIGTKLYTAPPAQVATRQGLTEALRQAREELSNVEWENDPPARVTDLFSKIDALLEGAKR